MLRPVRANRGLRVAREPRRGIDGFARKLAARLLAQDHGATADRLTRNRHFELFADDPGRLALRLYRYLRSIRRDILGASQAPVQVERGCDGDGDRVRLRIAVRGGAVRTAYLSADELDLLLQTPGVRGRLVG